MSESPTAKRAKVKRVRDIACNICTIGIALFGGTPKRKKREVKTKGRLKIVFLGSA